MSLNHLKDAKVALNVPIRYYFTGGNSRDINGQSTPFPDCEIGYHLSDLLESGHSTKPRVTFSLIQGGDTRTLKKDEKFLHEMKFTGNVYVSVAIKEIHVDSSGNKVHPQELADEVWSLLFAVVNTQTKRFGDLGVYHIFIDPTPASTKDEKRDVLILFGRFSLEWHVELAHDIP